LWRKKFRRARAGFKFGGTPKRPPVQFPIGLSQKRVEFFGFLSPEIFYYLFLSEKPQRAFAQEK
jgi:hypothetical protein